MRLEEWNQAFQHFIDDHLLPTSEASSHIVDIGEENYNACSVRYRESGINDYSERDPHKAQKYGSQIRNKDEPESDVKESPQHGKPDTGDGGEKAMTETFLLEAFFSKEHVGEIKVNHE